MRILVSNDDGYLAPGLMALADAMRPLGEVTVVAPEQNSSGASNSLTLHRPLTISQAENGFTFINGTPSDCVHIALTGLLDQMPDLIVSGINNGQNMGDDTIYSGTVAAAMEGYLFGVPAIAFSLLDRGFEHVDVAADVARQTCSSAISTGRSAQPFLLNVNVPSLPRDQIKGIVGTRLGQAPSVRAGGSNDESARRADLLDRRRGCCARRRAGHRFSCDRVGLCVGDAAADRPDAQRSTEERDRLARCGVGSMTPFAPSTAGAAIKIRAGSCPRACATAWSSAFANLACAIRACWKRCVIVPRHLFVDEALASRAYEDTALPIGHGQTISQPYIVARTAELALEDLPDARAARVLEVGTGCGYAAAVLAQLFGEVVSVERLARVA